MKFNLVFLILSLLPFFANAQTITWGGNIDFEYRQGGEDSRAGLNWTPTPNPTIYTPFVRLWAGIDFSEKLWADVTLQSDYYEGPSPSPVFVSMVQINYLPFESSNFTVSAGKFVIPFGLEKDRFLNIDNPFANYSLLHQWNLHLDKTTGYYGITPLEGYGGMALVYGRRYTQGIHFHGRFGEEKVLEYDLALTTAAASSFFPYSKNSKPAFIGRVTFSPFIWAKIGLSGTSGPFMDGMSNPRNENKNQFAYASDISLNHGYFEFNAQFTQSFWHNANHGVDYPELASSISASTHVLSTNHYMVEFIGNAPFLPGLWLATRYEKMDFSKHNFASSAYSAITWMRNMERFEVSVGKKLTRNAVLKTSFMNGFNAGPIEWEDWVFAMQISTVF